MERSWKTNAETPPSCPRCGSLNTKFCYYNNYSLTQPRYFCKGCRRYWTKGGSLRNVPVGGGCRKNRRGKSLMRLSSSDSALSKRFIYSGAPHKGVCSSVGSPASPAANTPDGSQIDLAVVYANFLNPQTNSKTRYKHVPPRDHHLFHPSDPDDHLLMTSISNTNFEFNVQFPDKENGLVGCHLTISDISAVDETPMNENDPLLYYEDRAQDFTILDNRNFGLPPLPGEEMVPHQEILWSNTLLMDNDHNTLLQMQQQPLIGYETHQDPNNLLFGSWSPFDLSKC